MNFSLNVNVKEWRLKNGVSQKALSEASGISQGSISRIERGVQSNLTAETFRRLGEAMASLAACDETNDDVFLREDIVPLPQWDYSRPLSVVSWVQAGAWTDMQESIASGYSAEGAPVVTDKNVSSQAFALKVQGKSMEPRFFDGDVIIVDPNLECRNGDLCVARINDQTTFKRFRETSAEIRLEPLNDKYEILVVPKDRPVDFRVLGKVVDAKIKF